MSIDVPAICLRNCDLKRSAHCPAALPSHHIAVPLPPTSLLDHHWLGKARRGRTSLPTINPQAPSAPSAPSAPPPGTRRLHCAWRLPPPNTRSPGACAVPGGGSAAGENVGCWLSWWLDCWLLIVSCWSTSWLDCLLQYMPAAKIMNEILAIELPFFLGEPQWCWDVQWWPVMV